MKRYLIRASLCLLSFILGVAVFIIYSFYQSVARVEGELTSPALSAEVKIIRDRWGIPHIFAANEKDLFFASGFVQAQDRMWQMDLLRRAGSGRLSEIFGTKTLDTDKLMRTLGLKEAVRKDFEKLTPALKDLIQSYCDGVNAWMNSRKWNWPPEFLALRYRPEPWTVQDSFVAKVILAVALSEEYQAEIMRAKLVNKLGAEKALQILEEGVGMPPALEISELFSMKSPDFPQDVGSNNWVISGSRSQSGKPLLANDPHLQISLPPVWYEIHMSCPTLNVTGVTMPGVPLVIIGHNDSIAWGVTYSYADVQDVYIERINDSRDMYLNEEGWKPLVKKEERIFVKGRKTPELLDVLWTERGPVISPHIVKSRLPLSLRWTLYEGGNTFDALYQLDKANNWEEFCLALRNFDAPSQNFVYADIQGNIGYYLAGKIPVRPKLVALFPFPGWQKEGRWSGFLEENEKPNVLNPPDGLIVTANNKIVPDNYPFYISCDWFSPFRANRIKELLLSREKHTVDTFKAIQNDIHSNAAGLFLSYMKDVQGAGGKAKEALDLLKNWDAEMNAQPAAALYEVFVKTFNEEVFQDELGNDYKDFDALFGRKPAGIFRILSDRESPWFDKKNTPAVEDRDAVIKSSLESAYGWLEENYGPPRKWDWPKMHAIEFQHSLGQVPVLKFFNKGKHPVSGEIFTVKATFSQGYETKVGPSYRQIIDLSDLNRSISVISSGQNGHFLGRHYGDQIPLWLEGRYHPMLFEHKDIQANSEGVLIMKPTPEKK